MVRINMKHRTTIRILVLSLSLSSFSVPSLFGSRNAGPPTPTGGLENGTLSLRFSEPGLSILTNKLTGRSYTLSAEPFALLFEIGGSRFRATAGDFLLIKTENPSPASLRLHYGGAEGRKALAVQVDYELGEKAWYVRKRLTVLNGLGEVVVIHDATVDDVRLKESPFPAKAENPIFLDGQLFWGMEWPIAETDLRDGRFRLTHFPAASLPPGGSWTSKTTGFGVSESGRIEEAFGRYIQVIRANRVDFATFYFDWLCHDNSGPLESEILANFAALKKLREMYGLQIDIYNSDAGLVESQGTYFPQFKTTFEKRFPNGLRPIADASARLGMKLGLWIGPDGFGEMPAEMAARRNQLLSWVRDFNVGLFKMDTVVSSLAHKNKYILEKKYQSLADALAEARRIDPSFVAINHRINNSPYMLTITDCLLWKGEETYIDVHITNRTAALHNRASSIGRELTSEFYNTPFRQFEDHGICFNSCVEKWEDDLVAQAFGRASVLSPELYGTFFFLRDEDYPRLARLIQLHKRSESLLKKAFPLSEGDIAHGDGRSSMIVLRNPTWAYRTKSVPLDGTIGLAAVPGTPLTVRQRHPREFLISKQGIKAGESLRIELEPFDVQMIQVDTGLPDEPYLGGVPYEVVPGPDADSFDMRLLGDPGRDCDVSFHNFGGRSVLSEGRAVNAAGEKTWRVRFPGQPIAGKPFSRLKDFTDAPPGRIDGSYLAELAKFTVDDDALEVREMDSLKRAPSFLPEIEACREYMWRKVITAEGSARNAFDDDPVTRWSDGYSKRSPFTGSPAPYRSDTSLWRIDLGGPADLRKLELQIVRKTEDGFLDAVEVSPDLKTWARVDGLSLKKAEGIPLFTEIRQRGKQIRIYDIEAGDNKPVLIEVPLPPNRSRYVRIRGRNFSVSEIVGYDGQGRRLNRGRWHATNFFGETPRPGRVLKSEEVLKEYRPGLEFAIAVHSGTAKFDPVDGVYVVAVVDGRIVVPRHRVPSYPYHNYEWNCSWIKNERLAGMTFRLPGQKEWVGKAVEFYVVLFGEGLDEARAELHLVAPHRGSIERRLQVRPIQALKNGPSNY
jgi:hypothetical protein